jgi:ABC-type uncharacterized transport system substrate-binding protein
LFARPEHDQQFDYLFVDEAGQVSLANIVATGTAARNIMFPEIAQKGGMLAYGPDLPSLYRQVAVLANKLLQGAKPVDVPVERPTRFQLVVNLMTAKALSISMPTSLLLRADEVIE